MFKFQLYNNNIDIESDNIKMALKDYYNKTQNSYAVLLSGDKKYSFDILHIYNNNKRKLKFNSIKEQNQVGGGEMVGYHEYIRLYFSESIHYLRSVKSELLKTIQTIYNSKFIVILNITDNVGDKILYFGGEPYVMKYYSTLDFTILNLSGNILNSRVMSEFLGYTMYKQPGLNLNLVYIDNNVTMPNTYYYPNNLLWRKSLREMPGYNGGILYDMIYGEKIQNVKDIDPTIDDKYINAEFNINIIMANIFKKIKNIK